MHCCWDVAMTTLGMGAHSTAASKSGNMLFRAATSGERLSSPGPGC